MLCENLLRCARSSWLLAGFLLLSVLAGDRVSEAAEESKQKEAAGTRLFDGKALGEWKIVAEGEFAKHGPVEIRDEMLVLGTGDPATGIRWSGDFPKRNYEIQLEAKRLEGDDFFCGMTFPVGEGHLTLILGGWGGWVVGLSCIDGAYAIDNETSKGIPFEQDRWYRVRLRVSGSKVDVWIDDKQVIDFATKDRKLSVSEEMQPCAPLGFATWRTTGALRQIRYRNLANEE